MTGAEDNIDVASFLASPRHSYWFLHSENAIRQILDRASSMFTNGGRIKRPGKGIIVSFHDNFAEAHDGNCSLVVWVLYRRLRGKSTLWKDLKSNCTVKAALKNRKHHESGEYWHPYVTGNVKCRESLQLAPLDEKGKQSRKALTMDGKPVYFNNVDYFSGYDRSVTIGETVDRLREEITLVRNFCIENAKGRNSL